MTDREQKTNLGRLARISGEVRAASARWEVEVQRALLEDGAPQPDDNALLDRLCENTDLGQLAMPRSAGEPSHLAGPDLSVWKRRWPLRTMTYVAAAAVLLLSFAAFGLGLRAALTSSETTPPAPSATALPPDAKKPRRPAGIPVPAARASEALLLHEPPPASVGSVTSPAPNNESATQLFAAAKVAQRAGDLMLAVSRFERLQQRFPLSAEAQVSHVVLGSLVMNRREAARALAQYQSYLERGGPLAEDALLGRARALGALGRTAEEARAWQALLQRYPDSVHSERARERLRRLREQP